MRFGRRVAKRNYGKCHYPAMKVVDATNNAGKTTHRGSEAANRGSEAASEEGQTAHFFGGVLHQKISERYRS